MLLGALVDAGCPIERIHDVARGLGLDAVGIRAESVVRGGLRATHLIVDEGTPPAVRTAAELIERVRAAPLAERVRTRSVEALEVLTATEAAIHGTAAGAGHLHELSGADTLIDVVGTFAALEALGITEVAASAINVGGGTVRIAHGRVGVPAPTTAALLQGLPIYGAAEDAGELTTPTGALLLRSLVTSWGGPPPMRTDAIGHGAGTRETASPNVLRCLLGAREGARAADARPTEQVAVLETNIDDLQPQAYEHVSDALFAAGALDVVLIPVIAKRGRPGVIVQAIARPQDVDALTDILFRETTTLGIRRSTVERLALQREIVQRETTLGRIQVKVATLPDGSRREAPEYRDLVRIARERGLPLIEVMRRVASELGSARDSDA